MRFTDLKKIYEKSPEGAPEQGQLLIYARDKVMFQGYTSLEEVEKLCSGKELLEVHLFDGEKEYRALYSTSNMAEKTGGVIEYTAAFPYDEKNVFMEKQLLEMDARNPRAGTKDTFLCVLNHISYNASGLASVDDYRMVMGGER